MHFNNTDDNSSNPQQENTPQTSHSRTDSSYLRSMYVALLGFVLSIKSFPTSISLAENDSKISSDFKLHEPVDIAGIFLDSFFLL